MIPDHCKRYFDVLLSSPYFIYLFLGKEGFSNHVALKTGILPVEK